MVSIIEEKKRFVGDFPFSFDSEGELNSVCLNRKDKYVYKQTLLGGVGTIHHQQQQISTFYTSSCSRPPRLSFKKNKLGEEMYEPKELNSTEIISSCFGSTNFKLL